MAQGAAMRVLGRLRRISKGSPRGEVSRRGSRGGCQASVGRMGGGRRNGLLVGVGRAATPSLAAPRSRKPFSGLRSASRSHDRLGRGIARRPRWTVSIYRAMGGSERPRWLPRTAPARPRPRGTRDRDRRDKTRGAASKGRSGVEAKGGAKRGVDLGLGPARALEDARNRGDRAGAAGGARRGPRSPRS